MFELLFSLASIGIVVWLLMIVLPTWRVTRFLADLKIFPIYLSILYIVGIITVIFMNGIGFMQYFSSATGVIQLLSEPNFALLVWIHLLCFDLFVGHFIYQENLEYRFIPLPLQSIILFLTLMFGPLGLLTYVVLRKARNREGS
ncbi:ABA4-like family protein [Metabacillus sp. FJAT-53654]|uniref:ABA4-like family protein n=1 Tax=Metabacillus rhizosphaerae TaxID=3117747 RepID=A0ABZ2MRD3_9BACI